MANEIMVIPDIHGELDKLNDILSQLDIPSLELLVFTGDYVDRGPDSVGVLKRVKEVLESHDNVVVLAGNHEWLMIDAISNPNDRTTWLWIANGGGYSVSHELVKWAAALPLFHETDEFFFSHAPISAAARLNPELSKNDYIWTYERPEGHVERRLPGKVGVCGHIHGLPESNAVPRFYDHYIYCDVGCGCSSKSPLVAVNVRDRTYITSKM